MLITYSPEDGQAREWEFKPDRVRAVEAELLEKRFGGTWDQFQVGIRAGNMRARRVLLWHLLRRDGHATLRYDDTPDFYAGEVVVEYDVAELLQMRDNIEKADIDEDQRSPLLSNLDREIAEAREKAARIAGVDVTEVELEPGKAHSSTSV